MRHQKKKSKISRDYDHRRWLMKNLVRQLFIHGKIQTTWKKAKLASSLAERLLTKAKSKDIKARRFLFRYFQDQHFVNEIVEKLAPRFAKNKGGMTRIKKLKRRKGDNALLAVLEFVDKKGGLKEEKEKKEEKEVVKNQQKEAKKKK